MGKSSLMIVLGLAVTLLGSSPAAAQALPFDHVHLAVPDVAQAVIWYRQYVGGEPIPGEPPNRLMIGDTRLVFMENKSPAPTTGSAINHVGYGNPDVPATAALILENGGSRLAEKSPLPGAVMLSDPWGTRLELVPAQRRQVHHVHLASDDPHLAADWYGQMFQGEPATEAGEVTVTFGDVSLMIAKGKAGPSGGSAYDHMGWRTPQLEATLVKLQAAMVRSLSEIEKRGATTRVIFVEGPSGAKIELLQR